jgi:hypothetical protein
VSPVALPADPRELRVPIGVALSGFVISVTTAAGLIWSASAAYGRLGTLESSVERNSNRIEEMHVVRERLVRLETILDRIEGKLDRVSR